MRTVITSDAAVLLALAPSVLAVGSASIANMCPYTVYYAFIAGQSEALQPLDSGCSMSQGYSVEGLGISVKLAMNNTLAGPISQFEYTWASGKIYYDLSNINGYPFSSGGMIVTPSMSDDPNNPTCVPIVCPAGDAVCSAAYNAPDDIRTIVCNDTASISLTLCSGGSSKRDVHIHPRSRTRPIRYTHRRRPGVSLRNS